MNYCRHTLLPLAIATALLASGCSTKFGRDFKKQVDLTTDGITNTSSNLSEGFSHACNEAPKVSEDADEILRLTSSEDNTVFTVDGKKMGTAKQLKVCINSEGEHTVLAEPPGCEAKIEKLKPPYDFPSFEFRFMLAECKGVQTTTPYSPDRNTLENSRKIVTRVPGGSRGGFKKKKSH
jgi:hypothetical protein